LAKALPHPGPLPKKRENILPQTAEVKHLVSFIRNSERGISK
jgi:hypothetical protein